MHLRSVNSWLLILFPLATSLGSVIDKVLISTISRQNDQVTDRPSTPLFNTGSSSLLIITFCSLCTMIVSDCDVPVEPSTNDHYHYHQQEMHSQPSLMPPDNRREFRQSCTRVTESPFVFVFENLMFKQQKLLETNDESPYSLLKQ